jgi:flagellar biosynthesis/type III secretory pathway protein FliH
MRRLKGMFGVGSGSAGEKEAARPLLEPEEHEKIGTDGDPLRDFEDALLRNTEAQKTEERGDAEEAARLYEKSVAEGFVGAHPYERLAALHEQRRDPEAALRVTEAYLELAKSGTMPRGAQKSADRKLPEFEGRAERLRRRLDG